MAAKKTDNPWDAFELLDSMPANVVKGPGLDPVEFRRKRVLDAIEVQRNLWSNPQFTQPKVIYKDNPDGGRRLGVTVEKQPRKWWEKSGKDHVVMQARYGNRPFHIAGKAFVKLANEQVPMFFDVLEERINAGEFDEEFQQLATRKKS